MAARQLAGKKLFNISLLILVYTIGAGLFFIDRSDPGSVAARGYYACATAGAADSPSIVSKTKNKYNDTAVSPVEGLAVSSGFAGQVLPVRVSGSVTFGSISFPSRAPPAPAYGTHRG